MLTETRTVDGIEARRYVRDGRAVYSAWEPSQIGEHSTITFAGSACYGHMRSSRCGEEVFSGMPVGPARFSAVDAHFDYHREREVQSIVRAFPEAAEGEWVMGDWTVTL